MKDGQTLYDQDKPNGYQDWPLQFTAAGGDSATKSVPAFLPIPGFGDANGLYQHEIRCSYCINAYNPIGTAPAAGSYIAPCQYYTQSVGFGPYINGNLASPKTGSINRPGALIVATDGIYMGRQSVVRLGEQNRRIGYRHLGAGVTANVNGTPTHFEKHPLQRRLRRRPRRLHLQRRHAPQQRRPRKQRPLQLPRRTIISTSPFLSDIVR